MIMEKVKDREISQIIQELENKVKETDGGTAWIIDLLIEITEILSDDSLALTWYPINNFKTCLEILTEREIPELSEITLEILWDIKSASNYETKKFREYISRLKQIKENLMTNKIGKLKEKDLGGIIGSTRRYTIRILINEIKEFLAELEKAINSESIISVARSLLNMLINGYEIDISSNLWNFDFIEAFRSKGVILTSELEKTITNIQVSNETVKLTYLDHRTKEFYLEQAGEREKALLVFILLFPRFKDKAKEFLARKT